MTADAPWFSFEERDRGRLSPGYHADVAVLTDDFFEVPEDSILDIRSALTIIGGEVAWDAFVKS